MYEQLISLLGGVLAPFIVKQLVKALKVKDFLAWLVAVAVSTVLAIAAVLVSGELGLADFTLANFSTAFVVVYVAAETLFKLGKYAKPS